MKNLLTLVAFVAVLVGGGVWAMQAMLPKPQHECAHCVANQFKCCKDHPPKGKLAQPPASAAL
jgi:hypothetical protein